MDNENIKQKVIEIIKLILQDKNINLPNDVSPEVSLYEGGLGLDSLDAATLSVALEREFETDPYSAGKFPRTIGDLLVFYGYKKAENDL